jgi:hypothetical protein
MDRRRDPVPAANPRPCWDLCCPSHSSAGAGLQPGEDLRWWETGAMCERRYRVGEQWYNLRPDALAAYRMGSQQFRIWLQHLPQGDQEGHTAG